MDAPLVRERSGVQSSLAAPSSLFEITGFSEPRFGANMQLATERNAKTRLETGKIRGPLFPGRSRNASQICEGQSETKTPTTAATVTGACDSSLRCVATRYVALRSAAERRGAMLCFALPSVARLHVALRSAAMSSDAKRRGTTRGNAYPILILRTSGGLA